MSQSVLSAPVRVESLDQEGRGVARLDGKALFIEGALPGELVRYRIGRDKSSYAFASMTDIVEGSSQRVTPACEYFGRCGGCAIQHFEFSAQVAAKQRLLESNLQHIGKVKPSSILPALYGPAWGYRHKARLRVRYVAKKQRVLVGFNEKATPYVADMLSCRVLPAHVSALIEPLQRCILQLSLREQIPQIEVAVGEQTTVLVFRILQALAPEDEVILKQFADQHQAQIWTQTKGLDTVKPFYPLQAPALNYRLTEYDLNYPFHPTEFTQVNPWINQVMIRRAMNLLSPQAGEKIADFFCGLGNFSLPIARSGAQVWGYEGLSGLVERAEQSAAINELQAQTSFFVQNLFEMTDEALQALPHFDKWLVDPPRDGAMALVSALPPAENKQAHRPKRIVYVSCNPATLARDAGILVNEKGYQLKAAGVINMFPHTAHIESIALFELDQ